MKQFAMSYSAEESSPIEYFESCCVCEEEFSSDSLLANHLLDHTNDEDYQAQVKELEQKGSPLKSVTPRNKAPEYTRTCFVREPTIKRSFSQRSKSPEIVEIDDSDEEDSNKKKPVEQPKLFKPITATNNVNAKKQTSAPINATPYNCQVCKMGFKDDKLYKEHLLTHDKARPYSCEICNKKFAYKGTLRQHLHLHIGEKSHECKICHKKFSMKRMLRQHEETHQMPQNQGQTVSSQLQR